MRLWDENLLQGPPPHEPFPLVLGITVHLTFAQSAYVLARWYRERGALVVLGGLHVSACPDEAAPHGDALAIGDGVRSGRGSSWPRRGAGSSRRRGGGTWPSGRGSRGNRRAQHSQLGRMRASVSPRRSHEVSGHRRAQRPEGPGEAGHLLGDVPHGDAAGEGDESGGAKVRPVPSRSRTAPGADLLLAESARKAGSRSRPATRGSRSRRRRTRDAARRPFPLPRGGRPGAARLKPRRDRARAGTRCRSSSARRPLQRSGCRIADTAGFRPSSRRHIRRRSRCSKRRPPSGRGRRRNGRVPGAYRPVSQLSEMAD